MYQVAYILTASSENAYAEMALISVLSLRITNPTLPITLVCDALSADFIRNSCRPLVDSVDNFKVVETPGGCPTFRHRWIKTRLGLILTGDLLFVDSDTLIRGEISSLPGLVRQFGAVLNHNGNSVAEQIWDEDRQNLLQMGWSDQFYSYFNSGVWMWRAGDAMSRFFETWHDMWLQSVHATGRLRDQPSFNRAISDLGIDVTILPRSYNEQVALHWEHTSDAFLWHFYSNMTMIRSSFTHLIAAARIDSLSSLRKKVGRAIRASAPWPNIDPLAIWISNRTGRAEQLRAFEKMWLDNRKREALQWLLATPMRQIRARLNLSVRKN